jgi:hypothetical protein
MKKNKKRSGIFLLKGEVFPYDVLVCLGVSREDVLRYYKNRFVVDLTDAEKEAFNCSGRGQTLRLENRAFILWLKDFPQTPDHFGYLAHEIFHTGDLMLRRAGVMLSDDSDEAFAYQIDWLTRNIYREFDL